MNLVVHDAEKKAAKPDGGQTLRAVGPMMEVVRGGVVREPDERISASEFELRLGDCIWKTANLTKLHCYKTYRAPQEEDAMAETDRASSRDTARLPAHDVKGKMPMGRSRDENSPLAEETPLTRPGSSTSSLREFDFECGFECGFEWESALPKRHPDHVYPGAEIWHSQVLAPSRSIESNTLAGSAYNDGSEDGDDGYYVVKEQGDTAASIQQRALGQQLNTEGTRVALPPEGQGQGMGKAASAGKENFSRPRGLVPR